MSLLWRTMGTLHRIHWVAERPWSRWWSRGGAVPRGRLLSSTVIPVDLYGLSFYLCDFDLGQLWPEGRNSRLVTQRTSWRNEWAAILSPFAVAIPAERPRARHWTLNQPSPNCSARRDGFGDGRCQSWDKTILSTVHVKVSYLVRPEPSKFIKWARIWACLREEVELCSVSPAVWLSW